ncbi:unnamed protein product [Haemonchus placei]|uniref:Asp/Glu/hydantoin racemase n=1 Tax=Haemonchus placei TaxID=6290 RepID=A0A0N4VUK4_HAEPC|nr:unnamed protein product [Haemonchus placei]
MNFSSPIVTDAQALLIPNSFDTRAIGATAAGPFLVRLCKMAHHDVRYERIRSVERPEPGVTKSLKI